MNLGARPGTRRPGISSARSRRRSRQGAIPDTVLLLEHPPTVTLGRRTEPGEVHIPDGADVDVVETDRGGKSTFHGPGTARLLPDPRPEAARQGRQEVLPRPRGGDHPDARRVRARGDPDRRPDRRLARVAAAQDRLDRRPHQPLGHDPRLRAERRSRPGSVHRLDHGLRARGRGVHVARPRARPARVGRRGPPRRCGGVRRGLRPRVRRASRRRARPLGPAAACPARGPVGRPRRPLDCGDGGFAAGRRAAAPAGVDEGARAEREHPLLRRQEADPRREPEHDLRGGALPEHRRVLGPRHGDLPDPRRHLHPRLPLLLRPLRHAERARRPARAAAARPDGEGDGPEATSSSPRSTATTSPTAAPATTRRRSAR